MTSTNNPRIKDAVRLQQGKTRREQGRFLIDGIREISRAFESGISIVELFVWDKAVSQSRKAEEWERLFSKISRTNIPIRPVSQAVFEKLAFGERLEGVLAVAESRKGTWTDLRFPDRPLLGIVEKVEKPGNLGAIFRSADGAGIDALLIADPLCDLYNPNTIRASLGTVFRIPAIVDSAANIIAELKIRNILIAAARCEGAISYTEFDFTQPCAIALGSEADGLSDAWIGPEIVPIRLPMCGIADSLNVSNAAAVLFYEARRKRTG